MVQLKGGVTDRYMLTKRRGQFFTFYFTCVFSAKDFLAHKPAFVRMSTCFNHFILFKTFFYMIFYCYYVSGKPDRSWKGWGSKIRWSYFAFSLPTWLLFNSNPNYCKILKIPKMNLILLLYYFFLLILIFLLDTNKPIEKFQML